MKTICGANANMQGYDCCYALVDQFFTREFLNTCSWTGGSRSPDMKKIAFKTYKRTINIFYELVRLADPTFSEINTEKFFHSVLRNSKQRALHGASDRPKRKSKMRRRLGAANSYHYDNNEAHHAFVTNDSIYSIDEYSEEEPISGENTEQDTKLGLLEIAQAYATAVAQQHQHHTPQTQSSDDGQVTMSIPTSNFQWLPGGSSENYPNQY